MKVRHAYCLINMRKSITSISSAVKTASNLEHHVFLPHGRDKFGCGSPNSMWAGMGNNYITSHGLIYSQKMWLRIKFGSLVVLFTVIILIIISIASFLVLDAPM